MLTKAELQFLLHLVMKLERNRHFIGDGVTVGNACLAFRSKLTSSEVMSQLQKCIKEEPSSFSDQLLELILKMEQT